MALKLGQRIAMIFHHHWDGQRPLATSKLSAVATEQRLWPRVRPSRGPRPPPRRDVACCAAVVRHAKRSLRRHPPNHVMHEFPKDRTGQSAEGTICTESIACPSGWGTVAPRHRELEGGRQVPHNHAVPASAPMQSGRRHPIGHRAPSGRFFHRGQDGNECCAHHESRRACRPRCVHAMLPNKPIGSWWDARG
jgi:hypothetical protein